LTAALARCHLSFTIVSENSPGLYFLLTLARQYDLVLVDGKVNFPLQKIIYGNDDGESRTDLFWREDAQRSTDIFLDELLVRLTSLLKMAPVWACILIGGKSSRMGQPKHLIDQNNGAGESWLEKTVERVSSKVDGVVLSGGGDVPEALSALPRLPDIPGVDGPLSGLLPAFRWNPLSAWVFIACDMPLISEAAVQWLIAGRRAGSWGRVPRFADAEYCEPLFALYEPRAAQFFEELLLVNQLRIGQVGRHFKIDNPVIPDPLSNAWRNVNTPDQLQRLEST